MEANRRLFRLLVTLGLLYSQRLLADLPPMTVEVDAANAPRQLLHTHVHIPAAPGPLTLLYPKWIPGTHGPTGPVTDLADLTITAGDQPLRWQHDPVDMYAVHLQVPPGASAVDVTFDLLLPTGSSVTAKLLDLDWNQVLVYPQTIEPLKISCSTSLTLPAGWQCGTALTVVNREGNQFFFDTVSLETLVDSPVIAGEFFREVDLTPKESPGHFLDLAADSADALAVTPEQIRQFTRLVREVNVHFGAHHYRDYHFLLTLSDHVAHFGLEHHESSDNREGEDFLTDASAFSSGADLLPHEMTHSWNGKYRRPAGLATHDYQQPMEGELLWVYEGLTDYLGKVFAVRSGLQTNENFRAQLALIAAQLDSRTGRNWRSLADTAVCAQLLYGARGDGAVRRRGVDFYPEGDLLWLEADTLIREQTAGQKSLVDFCRKFHGGTSGMPRVIPYTLTDVLDTLNDVCPYDWKSFFQTRVYDLAPRPPLAGLENAGWRLAYTNGLPTFLSQRESRRKITDLSYSLGFILGADGMVADVIPGLPGDAAGLAPGQKLIAVNNRSWTPERLRDAIRTAATNAAPITLLLQDDDYYSTARLDYHDGEKYPVLERLPGQPDLLADILKPLTPEPPAAGTADKH